MRTWRVFAEPVTYADIYFVPQYSKLYVYNIRIIYSYITYRGTTLLKIVYEISSHHDFWLDFCFLSLDVWFAPVELMITIPFVALTGYARKKTTIIPCLKYIFACYPCVSLIYKPIDFRPARVRYPAFSTFRLHNLITYKLLFLFLLWLILHKAR